MRENFDLENLEIVASVVIGGNSDDIKGTRNPIVLRSQDTSVDSPFFTPPRFNRLQSSVWCRYSAKYLNIHHRDSVRL